MTAQIQRVDADAPHPHPEVQYRYEYAGRWDLSPSGPMSRAPVAATPDANGWRWPDTHFVRWRVVPDYDGSWYMADVVQAVCDSCGWADRWYGASSIDEDDETIPDIVRHAPEATTIVLVEER